jgi:hypothetical protein
VVHLEAEGDFLAAVLNLVEEVEDYQEGVDFQEEVEAV